ncbi:hypothetical protein B0H10DRAFT_1952703 [Mycena sp. CBHHK59/15]|nr:hypothetical protein B0H10DRAFT_1952703 [Mycena sp. CBHHK59/15]
MPFCSLCLSALFVAVPFPEPLMADALPVSSSHSTAVSAPALAASPSKPMGFSLASLHAAAVTIGAASSATSASAFLSPGVHAHHNYAMYASASSLPGVHAHQEHATYVSASSSSGAGPSSVPVTSGPVSPLASCNLDALFTSCDPLQNVITGDLYCVYSHLELRGIPMCSLNVVEARQAIVYHLLSGMCATKLPNGLPALPHLGIILCTSFDNTHLKTIASAINAPSGSDVNAVLAQKRAELVDSHGVSNPLHSIFDSVENGWFLSFGLRFIARSVRSL